jgi:hypothetical protein
VINSNRNINRSTPAKIQSGARLAESLAVEKLLLIGAGLLSTLSVLFLLYSTYATDRLEQVFVTQTVMDAPVLLEKTRESVSETRIDRHVRGFVRRFVSRFFIHPDDTAEFAEDSLRWLHAHTEEQGRSRSEYLITDVDKYNSARKTIFNSFFAVNDPSSLKISSAKTGNRVFHISQPGTFVASSEEGEAFYDAVLELVVVRVPVSGISSGLGQINVTGLSVEEAHIVYREDQNKSREITRKNLFTGRF